MPVQDPTTTAPTSEVPLTTFNTAAAQNTPKPDPKIQANFEHFELIIYNQVGLVFKGFVHAIASANNQGPFSVLPGHTNFISMLTETVSVHLPNGEVQTFEVGLGVLRCLNNRVEVFAGLYVNSDAEIKAKQLQVA